MRRTRLATTALLLLLPAATAAEQLEYGLTTQGGWTQNVFGTAQDEIDDWSVRASPWGKVSDPDGDFTWSVRYQPSYEYYLDQYELRGFDNDANAEAAWRVADRTTLFATETIQQFHSLVRFNENAGSFTDPAVFRGQRDKIFSTLTTVGLRHDLTSRDLLSLSGNYKTRDYDNSGSSDLASFTFGTSYLHSVSERTRFGLQGSWIRQTFTRSIGSDLVTNYYNLSGVLEHEFSRTLRLELSVGPALIDSDDAVFNFVPKYGVTRSPFGALLPIDADGCPLLNDALPVQEDPTLPNYNPHVSGPGFAGCAPGSTALSPGELQLLGYPRGDPLVPGSTTSQTAKLTEFSDPYERDSSGGLQPADTGSSSLDVTYFAHAALIKDWERWHAVLSYQRENDDSGSFGASSVQDSLELNLRWEPAPLWTIDLLGAYTMIDQASDAAIPTGLVLQNEVVAGVDSVPYVAAVQHVVVDVSGNALSYTTASVSLTANRRLTLNSSAFAALYWYQQRQQVDLPNNDISFLPGSKSASNSVTRWDNITLFVGFDWHFGTIKF